MHQINDYQLARIKESAQDNLKILKQLHQHDPSVYRVRIEMRDTQEVLTIVAELEASAKERKLKMERK